MRSSEIKIIVNLDDQNIPEKIQWEAEDSDAQGLLESKSMCLALWDHHNSNTLRIDLWTKDMPVDDMRKFYIDCIGGMAQSVLNATGDEFMASEMNNLCDKLVLYLKRELEG